MKRIYRTNFTRGIGIKQKKVKFSISGRVALSSELIKMIPNYKHKLAFSVDKTEGLLLSAKDADWPIREYKAGLNGKYSNSAFYCRLLTEYILKMHGATKWCVFKFKDVNNEGDILLELENKE